jgi:glycosyltransferase involved in cell wall biosynthesis
LNAWHPFFNRKGLRRFGLCAFMLRAYAYLHRHRQEYDIVHAHSAKITGFVGVLAGRRLKKKNIIKVMNSGLQNDVLLFRQDKTIPGARWMADYLVHCDRAVTLNPLAYDELLALGFRPDQIEMIPNGVEAADIAPKAGYASDGIVRAAFAGRLDRPKGLDVLLEAVRILSLQERASPCQLVVLGKGPLRQALEQLAAAMGITDRVQFMGEVNDVPSHLIKADMFVLPSRAEGISNALLEAMAAGLPCVVTDIPGNNTLIRHDQNGLLVDRDDAASLARAIRQLADDGALRERLGRSARRTVEEQFDIRSIARRYIDLYQRLLHAPQHTVPAG